MFWFFFREFVMLRWWIRGLKNFSDVEKFEKEVCFVRIRVWVIFEIFRVRVIFRVVIIMVVILMDSGIVVGGVFVGIINEVMRNFVVMFFSVS